MGFSTDCVHHKGEEEGKRGSGAHLSLSAFSMRGWYLSISSLA